MTNSQELEVEKTPQFADDAAAAAARN